MPEMDPRIGTYLEKNRKWAQSKDYVPPIPFVEMQRRGRERRDGGLIVVACTDPRVTPEEFLGMDSTSKSACIRTTGGRVLPALSSLITLAAVSNGGHKGTIMIIHHTDCGLQTIDDDGIKKVMEQSVGGLGEGESVDSMYDRMEAVGVLDGMEFGTFVRPEDSVKEDVEMLRDSPFFKGMQIVGFVQDTHTGILTEVKVE